MKKQVTNKPKKVRGYPVMELVNLLVVQNNAQKELGRPKRKNKYMLTDDDGSQISL